LIFHWVSTHSGTILERHRVETSGLADIDARFAILTENVTFWAGTQETTISV